MGLAKLAPLAVAVAVAGGAFALLVSWYCSRYSARETTTVRCYPTLFDFLGVALAAWMLAAFAIGVLAGVLVRRVIPAIFATLAAWAGLAFVTGIFLRQHYEAPLVTSSPNFLPPRG